MTLEKYTKTHPRSPFRIHLGDEEIDEYDLEGIRRYLSNPDPSIVHGMLQECPALLMSLTQTISDLKRHVYQVKLDLEIHVAQTEKYFKGMTLKDILRKSGKKDFSDYSATELKKKVTDSMVKSHVKTRKKYQELSEELLHAETDLFRLTEFKKDVLVMWETLRSLNRDMYELRSK